MRTGIRLLPVWALLLSGASPAAETVGAEQAAAIDGIFARHVRQDSPGCIVGLIRGGSVVHWRGYGRADVEAALPFTPDSVLGTGSVYKHFHAAGILLLAEEGRLSLSDDIRRHLPELPDYAARITLRQLLDHSHGLREYQDLVAFARGPFEGDRSIVRLLARQRQPAAAPGERFHYGSTGPVLAGQIIERITGEPAARFLARRLFEPLGMSRTALGDDGRRVPPRIAAYVQQPDGSFRRREPNLGYRTTTADLARWNGHFDTPDPVWRGVLQQMTTPSRLANGRRLDFGLGLRLSPYRGLRRIWHPGAGTGYRTIFMRFPDARLTIALGCNQEINPITAAEAVADVVLAREIARRRPASDVSRSDGRSSRVSAEHRRILSGTYVSDGGQVARVAPYGDGLRLSFEGAEHDLLQSRRFRFTIAGRPPFPRDPVNEIVFSPAGKGRPATMEARTNWYPVTFRSVDPVDPALVDKADYAGTYRSDEVESSLRVFARGGDLVVAMPDGEHVLEPIARDLFRAGPQTVRFARKQGRIATALVARGAIPRLAFERVGQGGAADRP
jgi:CubicO group peptidase (beta-lactamase class C family)